MQLFITNNIQITPSTTQHAGTKIEINDERVFYQCTKVLRYKAGDQIIIQFQNKRYTVELQSREKKSIQGLIVGTEARKQQGEYAIQNCLIVAMVNKRDKMELIAQKATEIGINTIGIRISKRSIIQIISDNKLQRLKLIMLEACEQSRNWHLPEIKIYHKIEELPRGFVAYQGGDCEVQHSKLGTMNSLIIGPEGGFDPIEINYFQNNGFEFVSLGDTILRTETAAIVGSWWLQNTL